MEEISVNCLPRPGPLMESTVKLPVSKPSMMLQSRSKVEKHVFDVRPEHKSLIVPETSTDSHWLPLTNLDRLVSPVFIRIIFFYENAFKAEGGWSSFRQVTASLKESLAKVLVHFYPLAGRLAVQQVEPEESIRRVDLHCNDAGAIFVEASVDVELAKLGGPQAMPMLSGMHEVRSGKGGYLPDESSPMPVLVIQVTKFSCGSIAVAVNWHHMVADGFSGCHFLRSWAEVARGEELGLRPSHGRQLLQPRNLPAPLSVSGYSCGTVAAVRQLPSSKSLRPLGLDSVNPTVVKSFMFKKENVQKRKEVLSESSKHGSHFTSAETISAELWKLMRRASSEDEDEDREKKSRFFMFVEGRKRLGLPPGYFGNVVCVASAVSTKRELLTNPVSYAASLIRTATRAINDEHFRGLIDWVEGQTSKVYSHHLQATGDDMAATFWTFFPLYQVNFGWGAPVLSVRNRSPQNSIDGLCILPTADSGSLMAMLNLHCDRMLRLEQDPEFPGAIGFQPLNMHGSLEKQRNPL